MSASAYREKDLRKMRVGLFPQPAHDLRTATPADGLRAYAGQFRDASAAYCQAIEKTAKAWDVLDELFGEMGGEAGPAQPSVSTVRASAEKLLSQYGGPRKTVSSTTSG